jgi:hypothetical protein
VRECKRRGEQGRGECKRAGEGTKGWEIAKGTRAMDVVSKRVEPTDGREQEDGARDGTEGGGKG